MQSNKAREVTLRRVLARRGFALRRCRARDASATGFGKYQIVDRLDRNDND